MLCQGPGRKGKEITSGRRDAQGLTVSVVIRTRVMQPGVSTREEQNWRIALCGYGMTLAPRHQVHLVCVSHRWRTSVVRTGSGDPWPDSVGGEGRVGSHPFPQLQRTPLLIWRWLAGVPVPVPAETQSAQRFTRLAITVAIEIAMPLAQQLLGTVVGANLTAAVTAATGSGAIGTGG